MPRAPQEELLRGLCENPAAPSRTRVKRHRKKVRARKYRRALLLHILNRLKQIMHRSAEKQDDGECMDRALRCSHLTLVKARSPVSQPSRKGLIQYRTKVNRRKTVSGVALESARTACVARSVIVFERLSDVLVLMINICGTPSADEYPICALRRRCNTEQSE